MNGPFGVWRVSVAGLKFRDPENAIWLSAPRPIGREAENRRRGKGEKVARGEEKARIMEWEVGVMVMRGLTAVTISGDAKKFTVHQLSIPEAGTGGAY